MRKAIGGIILLAMLATPAFGQTNKFHFRMAGREMGTEAYELTKTADGYRLSGTLHMLVPAPTDLTHELQLTPDLGFQRYKLTVAGGAQVIEAWREGDKIQLKANAGGQEKTKTLPLPAGQFVLLDNMISGHLQVLLNSLGGKAPSGAWTFLVPQAMTAIPGRVASVAEESATLEGKPIRARKYTIEVANVLEEMWAETGSNRLMRVYVPLQKAEFVREGFVLTPPPEAKPDAAAGFVEREVQFPRGALKFPATLCLPANAKGKVAMVVLVHGSGPNDRDETIGPNKPFRDIAHGLAAAGIGTLRYDKRTYAFKNQIDPKTLTVEEETIADAVAGIA